MILRTMKRVSGEQSKAGPGSEIPFLVTAAGNWSCQKPVSLPQVL